MIMAGYYCFTFLSFIGMAFDWKSRRLYYTNVGHSGPSLDGTVYNWHTIEFVDVETKKRKTLFHEVENPHSLALDLNQRFVFLKILSRVLSIKRMVIAQEIKNSDRNIYLFS